MTALSKRGSFNEKEARNLFRMVLDAVKYCHDRGIVHRDLKPENMLMTSEHEDAIVKLTGFDLAGSILTGLLSVQYGTPGYVAPEIIRAQAYGTEVDMWSLGVNLYVFLCGYPPFHDENREMLFGKIERGSFRFHTHYWESVSDEAKDLVRALLTGDPKNRTTAAEAIKHPWMLRTDADLLNNSSKGVDLEQPKMFNARRKLRGAIQTVLAVQRLERSLSGELKKKGDGEGPTSAPAFPALQQHVGGADPTQEELKAENARSRSPSRSGGSELSNDGQSAATSMSGPSKHAPSGYVPSSHHDGVTHDLMRQYEPSMYEADSQYDPGLYGRESGPRKYAPSGYVPSSHHGGVTHDLTYQYEPSMYEADSQYDPSLYGRESGPSK